MRISRIKKRIIISFFFLIIINYLIESIIVSILMNSSEYEGIGMLGLNFTLEGGDVFFFFYNFLILSIIIMVYCTWKIMHTNSKSIKDDYSDRKIKIILIMVLIFSGIEIINIIYRFLLPNVLNLGGMVILHFILDLIYNISISISYAALILIKYN